jgi:hypothetical protein
LAIRREGIDGAFHHFRLGEIGAGVDIGRSRKPPEKPGLYAIRFFATLDSGARLEARGLLTVIEDKARR